MRQPAASRSEVRNGRYRSYSLSRSIDIWWATNGRISGRMQIIVVWAQQRRFRGVLLVQRGLSFCLPRKVLTHKNKLQ